MCIKQREKKEKEMYHKGGGVTADRPEADAVLFHPLAVLLQAGQQQIAATTESYGMRRNRDRMAELKQMPPKSNERLDVAPRTYRQEHYVLCLGWPRLQRVAHNQAALCQADRRATCVQSVNHAREQRKAHSAVSD